MARSRLSEQGAGRGRDGRTNDVGATDFDDARPKVVP